MNVKSSGNRCQGLTEAGRKVHKLCVETKSKPSDFADLSPVRCKFPQAAQLNCIVDSHAHTYILFTFLLKQASHYDCCRCPLQSTAQLQLLWCGPTAEPRVQFIAIAVAVFVCRGSDAAAAGEEAALGSSS